jgi:DNA-binding transcriptional LysR family regulator
MLDIELLRSFVSVVDTGGFTRAGERVHLTQSTVSQQIRRLEQTLGHLLLYRNGKHATPTEQGERLVSYARRILALEQEARDVVTQASSEGAVRLGIPEDFAAYRLTELLSDFARSRPGLRLDVQCALSVQIRRALERDELDLALFKRDAGERGGMVAWPEHLRWVTSRRYSLDFRNDPVPLVMFEQGCLYRERMIHAIETAGRRWHIAYVSRNLTGIQAAVSAGLGVSILPELAILTDHRPLETKEGFSPVTHTELALVIAANANAATRRLAEVLTEFCSSNHPHKAERRRHSRHASAGRLDGHKRK